MTTLTIENPKVAALSATERRALRALEQAGPCGLTDANLAYLLELHEPSVTKIRGSLVKAGLVRDKGFRRPTGRGNATATVWVVR